MAGKVAHLLQSFSRCTVKSNEPKYKVDVFSKRASLAGRSERSCRGPKLDHCYSLNIIQTGLNLTGVPLSVKRLNFEVRRSCVFFSKNRREILETELAREEFKICCGCGRTGSRISVVYKVWFKS